MNRSLACFLLAAAFSGSLAGCAGGPSRGNTYTVTLDGFQDADVSEIIQATTAWTDRTSARFKIVTGACVGYSDGAICMHALAAPAIYGTCESTRTVGCAVGETEVDGAEIWIDVEGSRVVASNGGLAWADDESLEAVAEHELGHALGLAHEDHTVMAASPTNDWRPLVTELDVAQYNALR